MFKIIAIDDNPVVVESLRDIIPWSQLGFDLAETFTNSQKAMDYIADNHVDVILSDIAMEEPNGLEIVRICEDTYPHIKIILLSAFRDFEYARKAIRYRNVLEYLTKPLDFGVLCDILKNLAESMHLPAGHSDFSSENTINRRLELFSNILCGYNVSPEEINESLNLLGINADAVNTPCSIVTLHIENLDNYLANVWKYSTLQLYYAICNAVPFESDNAYYSLANYSYSNLVWIIVHKDGSDNALTLRNFENDISSNLKELLQLDIGINFHKTYDNMCDLVSADALVHPEMPNENKTIAKAVAYMEENFAKDLSMKDVADYVFMSSSYFSTYFKRITGQKFIDMLTKIRITKAAEYLQQENLRVNEVCEMVGYGHMGNFYEKFKKYYNMTPAEYKNQFVRDNE